MGKLAVIGLTAAGVAAAVAGKKMLDLASDAEEVDSKLKVVFGDTLPGLSKNLDAFSEATGASRFQLREQAADMGALLVPLTANKQAAADMSLQFVKLATDLSSFNNVPVEEALLAIRSGLVGEAEPLRRFGVLLNESAVKAEALRMGLVKGKEELTEQQKVMARASLIMKQTSLAQGDATRTAGSMANQMRALSNNVKDAATTLGKMLIPVAQRVVGALNDAFEAVGRFIKRFSEAKGFKAKFNVVFTGIKEAGQGLATALGKFFWEGWTEELGGGAQRAAAGKMGAATSRFHQGMLKQLAALDWSAIGRGILDGIVKGMEAAKEIGGKLGRVIDEAFAKVDWIAAGQRMGPALIAMIGAAFMLIMDPAFWVANWELALSVAAVAFGGPIGRMASKFAGDMALAIAAQVERVFGPVIGAAILRGLTMAGQAISGAFTGLENLVRTVFGRLGGLAVFAIKVLGVDIAINAIRQFFENAERDLVNAATAVYNFSTRIDAAMATAASAVAAFASKLATAVASWIASVFTAAVNVGQSVTRGLVNGLAGAVTTVASLATRIGQAIVRGVVGGLGTIGEKLSGAFSGIYGFLGDAARKVVGPALRIALAIIEPFTHLPSFLGAPFRAAKDAINAQLGIIKAESGAVAQDTGYDIGYFIGLGLGTGVAASVATAVAAVRNAVNAVIAAANEAAGTHSESTKTKKIGREVIGGFITGMLQRVPELLRFASSIASSLIDTITDKASLEKAKAAGAKLAQALVANKALIDKAGRVLGDSTVNEIINGFLGRQPPPKEVLRKLLYDATAAGMEASKQAIRDNAESWASLMGSIAQMGLDAIDKKFAGWTPPALKELEAADAAKTWKDLNDQVATTEKLFNDAWAAGMKLTAELERWTSIQDQLSKGVAPAEIAGLTEEEKQKIAGMTPEEVTAFINENSAAALAAWEANNVKTTEALKNFEDAKYALWREKQTRLAADQQKAHDEEVEAEKKKFAKRLKNILADGVVTAKELKALFASFNLDFTDAGQAWGDALADGLRKSKPNVRAAAQEVAGIVADNIKRGSPAKEGPLSEFDMTDTGYQYGADLAEGLRKSAGLVRAAARKVAASASGATLLPPRQLGGGGTGRFTGRVPTEIEYLGTWKGNLGSGIYNRGDSGGVHVYFHGGTFIGGTRESIARELAPEIESALTRRQNRVGTLAFSS